MIRIKNKVKHFLLLFMICFCYESFSQTDSLFLTKDEFLSIVQKYHPLLKQANIQRQLALQNNKKSRGVFDPIIAAKTGEKNIDNTNYYNQNNIDITIPTWYGVDFNADYNLLKGDKLSNDDTKGEIYQVGVTIPLLKNLLYDKRRALVEQSLINMKMTDAEMIVFTNNFLLEAENEYWQWLQAYKILQLQTEVVNRNRERLDWTRKALIFGERAGIDTTEVYSQLQLFQLQQKEAEIDFINKSQDILVFLWKENQQPYDVVKPLLPKGEFNSTNSIDANSLYLQMNTDAARRTYQGLQFYTQKLKFLDVEYKAKKQDLLPKLDFSYNFFNRNFSNAEYLPFFNNNFQYGLKLEFPLLFRQARADMAMVKLKQNQTKLDFEIKNKELEIKINSLKNEIDNYAQQLKITESNLSNYRKLLKAEETRFENGESSVFLINSREMKVIETEIKIISLKTKMIKSYNKLKWLKNSMN